MALEKRCGLGGTVETIDGSGFNELTYEWTNFGHAGANLSQDLELVCITPDSLQIEDLSDPNFTGGPEPDPAQVSVLSLAGLGVDGSPGAFAGSHRPVRPELVR